MAFWEPGKQRDRQEKAAGLAGTQWAQQASKLILTLWGKEQEKPWPMQEDGGGSTETKTLMAILGLQSETSKRSRSKIQRLSHIHSGGWHPAPGIQTDASFMTYAVTVVQNKIKFSDAYRSPEMLLSWESSNAEGKLAVRLEAEVSGSVCTGSPPSSWEMKRSWLSREVSWKESTGNLLCHPLVYCLYQRQSADQGWWQLLKPFPVLHRAHAGDLRSTSAVISALQLVVGHLRSWPLAAPCPGSQHRSHAHFWACTPWPLGDPWGFPTAQTTHRRSDKQHKCKIHDTQGTNCN